MDSADLSQWEASATTPGVFALETVLAGGLRAHVNVAARSSADRLVVFLPGAQSKRRPRRPLYFNRWSWHDNIPDAHVVAISDPALALDERLLGAWFIHPDLDLIADLASVVQRIARVLGVEASRVTFHGSSLGGFAAMGMAAHLAGSTAISEIPQIDFEKWPYKESHRILESHLGGSISEFRERHPERIDVLSRFSFAGVVPSFTLVTNTADTSYDLHVGFMEDVRSLASECDVIGEQKLLVTDVVSGHSALPQDAVLDLLAVPAHR